MAQQKSVTLVISHMLDPEHGKRYEEWLGKIMPVAAEFPGHLGANVIRPGAGQNLWSVIIRFDTIEHLYAWTQSETRRELVAELRRCLTRAIAPRSVPSRLSGLPRRRPTCASRCAGSSF